MAENTTETLFRTERALSSLRREVETLRGERIELLEQIEFLTRMGNGSALAQTMEDPAEEVSIEKQEISWLEGDTQVDPPSNVHPLPRRRTRSEASLVIGEIRCAR